MKYIKLYEAFDSEILSGTVKFLDKSAKRVFLSDIKDICTRFDFPLSKLNDSLFKYLPYKKALMAGPDRREKEKCEYESEWIKGEFCKSGKVKRSWGKGVRIVECPHCKGTGLEPVRVEADIIKYWFNKDGKYITKTGSDGTITSSTELSNFSYNLDDYTKGRIIRTYDELLKLDGELIYFGRFSGYQNIISYVHVEDNRVFFIQNAVSHSGRNIKLKIQGGMRVLEYTRNFMDSTYTTTTSDVKGLRLLKPNTAKTLIHKMEYTDKGLNFNRNGISLYHDNNIISNLREAHFAIILDISKIKPLNISNSKIKSDRVESKSDAYALLKDEDIKRVNIARYVNEIAKRSSFTVDSLKNLTNFNKVILRIMGGRNILYHLASGTNFSTINRLYTLSNRLYDITNKLSSSDETFDDAERLLSELNQTLKSYLNDSNEINTRIDTRKRDNLSKMDAERKRVFDKIVEFSNVIYGVISNKELETLEDLEIFVQDMKYIKQLLGSDRIKINSLNDYFNVMSSSSTRGQYYSYLPTNNLDTLFKNIDSLESIIKRKIE